ncbi:hypothetical protein GCM10011487_54170 [Steroidobacter agaridevorans]|uniref:Vanillate O-demethylase oxygenase-like C-terminal catalytic domain-containing protein n=1 Tax=Steroidobacter agaridevorans TaxID=2695856 RepID=A0A829YJB8_9GAMM|nr:hypothetical protein [Steroidobacter agaridevorans]GFE83417.1 hypothetical protein GCM10011487_54170 [Steroidobacter agaridevorans]
MGDPAKADAALLPCISWSHDPSYLRLQGYMETNCSYIAVQENLMDDAHFNYLHCPPHIDWAEQPALWSLPVDIEVKDRTVTTVMKLLDVTLAPVEAIAMGLQVGQRVNRLGRCMSAAPGCYFAEWSFENPTPAPGAQSSFSLRGLHGMTPISADRCHWWWAYIQDYGHRAPRAFQAGWEAILQQDKDILEAIQMTADRAPAMEQPPHVLVGADRALVGLRRIFKQMLEVEDT